MLIKPIITRIDQFKRQKVLLDISITLYIFDFFFFWGLYKSLLGEHTFHFERLFGSSEIFPKFHRGSFVDLGRNHHINIICLSLPNRGMKFDNSKFSFPIEYLCIVTRSSYRTRWEKWNKNEKNDNSSKEAFSLNLWAADLW